MISGGIFDVADKENLLVDINNKLSEESTWSNLDLSQNLNKEKADLEKISRFFLFVDETINDNLDLLEIAIEESDEDSITEIAEETHSLTFRVEDLEFNRMFSNKMDPNSAFIDIQSGSGGTEAQDWAEMLLRMYTRWAEKHDFTVSVIEHSLRGCWHKISFIINKRKLCLWMAQDKKREFIDWSENLPLILAAEDIHHLHRFSFLLKSMNQLR